MKPGAIMCNQGQCLWLNLDLIGNCLKSCTNVFDSVDYSYTTIPTYPSGQIGFLICSTAPDVVLRRPVREPTPELQAQLKYYSPAIHAASFVLPVYGEEKVAAVRKPRVAYACTSGAPPMITRSSLVLAALGVAFGVVAATAVARR